MTAKTRTSAGRPQQPKCSCGKALYKRMDAGPVKTTDPYGFCRNRDCEHYNKDQSGESRFSPLARKSGAPKAKTIPPAAPKKSTIPPAKHKTSPPTKAPRPDKLGATIHEVLKTRDPARKPKTIVPPPSRDPISRARDQITQIMAEKGEHAKATVGIALGLLSQETGSKDAANLLISELALSDKYGIEPVSDSARKSKKNRANHKSA